MSVPLTVMTPVYNGAPFIKRSYYTLRQQTFQNWEWVVVDDGSTDESAELVRQIAQRDARVRLVSYEKNQGRGYARTKALEAAQGEWVVVWDVDDLYFPERLERINKARLRGFDYYASQTVIADTDLKPFGVRGFDEPFAALPLRTSYHPSMAMRTDLARQVGYLPRLRTVGQIGEDVPMVFLLAATKRGYFDEKPMAIYTVCNEVFLQKSIDANKVRISFWKQMYERGFLRMSAEEFEKVEAADCRKLRLLNILRLFPTLYPLLMRRKKRAEARASRPLNAEESSFLAYMRKRFIEQPTREPERDLPISIPTAALQPMYA